MCYELWVYVSVSLLMEGKLVPASLKAVTEDILFLIRMWTITPEKWGDHEININLVECEFLSSISIQSQLGGLFLPIHTSYIIMLICWLGGLYRGLARQPCYMAGTTDLFPMGKNFSFQCKTYSLFLPCNMAAVQNLYWKKKTFCFNLCVYNNWLLPLKSY